MRVIALLLLLTSLVAGAEPFAEGTEAYQTQAFARAAESFREAVAERPRDPAAHFNLGLCYFKLEDWGRARASWETAWTLAPQWQAPGQALGLLNGKIRDGRREVAGQRSPLYWLSMGQWLALLCFGWWLMVGGLVWRYRRHGDDPSLSSPPYPPGWGGQAQALFSVGLLLLLVGGLGSVARYLEPPRAVVVASKVFLKNGPGQEFTDSLSLYSGHLVKVQEHDGSWVEVVAGGQVRGWLRSAQLKEIPSY